MDTDIKIAKLTAKELRDAQMEKDDEDSFEDEERKKVQLEISEGIKVEVEWLSNLLHQFEADNGSLVHNKVAFNSSGDRKYFPEDPGTSRFGVEYSMAKAPGDVPNPNYFPPDNRLEKPAIISKKGYGIGGLLGKRFAKDPFENNPAPNAYNILPDIPLPPRRKSSIIPSKKEETQSQSPGSSPGSVTYTVKTATEPAFSNYDGGRLSEVDVPKPKFHAPQLTLSRAQLRNLCLQTFIGFGTSLSINRFGKEPKWHNVGVGYYDLRKKDAEIPKASSFGQKYVRLIPPAITRCNYKGYDKCFECREVLRTVDYYRTMKRIKNPFYQVKIADRVRDEEFGFHEESLDDVDATDYLMERKNVFVSLCRACYCRGIRGESEFWDPAEMPRIFKKTRHCSYIHDHQSLPIFTHKTDCSLVQKLSRKEILLSKYYKDACETVVKSN